MSAHRSPWTNISIASFLSVGFRGLLRCSTTCLWIWMATAIGCQFASRGQNSSVSNSFNKADTHEALQYFEARPSNRVPPIRMPITIWLRPITN